MIISLRGTNGAGKSTIVRNIMKMYKERREIIAYSRRKPLGYHLRNGDSKLFIPGHYEIANGGIDTLPDLALAYKLIAEHHNDGYHVLYEGKNLSDGTIHIAQIAPEFVTIIVVTHPVEECIQAVRDRGHKIKEETIRKIADKVVRDAKKLEGLGYAVHYLSRSEAYTKCASLLVNGSTAML